MNVQSLQTTVTSCTDAQVTVIVPLRVSPDRPDAVERIGLQRRNDPLIPNQVRFIVVDDGSSDHDAARIRQACASEGFDYLRIESEARVFSFARARNAGVRAARTPFVMFLDVDLMPYPGFYNDVLREIAVRDLANNQHEFLMWGVVYLTQAATREFEAMQPELRRPTFLQALLEHDTTRVEKFSTGTSVTVFSRIWYLIHGGQDESFEGWGYEDLEFGCRMLRLSKRFPLPNDFALDHRNFRDIVEFRGWKSVYRLYGDMTFHKGQVLFHAWHEVGASSQYMGRRAANRKQFERALEAFRKDRSEPQAISMPEAGRSIAFTNTVPFVWNRALLPMFGEVTVLDETRETPESVIEFARSHAADRIVFFNPFASEHRLSIYKACRDAGLQIYVCERGALRDSIFIDPAGFSSESTSYDPVHWNRPMSGARRARVLEYIDCERHESASLEQQSGRVGAAALRRQLKLGGKKILFVPLQRPSDTVIKYFIGPIGSYENFVELIGRLAAELPSNWAVVVKRHPLEVESPEIPNVVWANDANVKDLIELADSVYAINSGTGVLALALGKPVMVAGSAFYAYPGLAAQAHTYEAVRSRLLEAWAPDSEKVLRFISYLIEDFYSFGNMTVRTVDWEDGAKMTATTDIDFYRVRIPGLGRVDCARPSTPKVSSESVLFDRYRTSMQAAGKTAKPVAAPKVEAKPAMSAKRTKPALRRKLRKLAEDPSQFFSDSKKPALKWIGRALYGQPG